MPHLTRNRNGGVEMSENLRTSLELIYESLGKKPMYSLTSVGKYLGKKPQTLITDNDIEVMHHSGRYYVSAISLAKYIGG